MNSLGATLGTNATSYLGELGTPSLGATAASQAPLRTSTVPAKCQTSMTNYSARQITRQITEPSIHFFAGLTMSFTDQATERQNRSGQHKSGRPAEGSHG